LDAALREAIVRELLRQYWRDNVRALVPWMERGAEELWVEAGLWPRGLMQEAWREDLIPAGAQPALASGGARPSVQTRKADWREILAARFRRFVQKLDLEACLALEAWGALAAASPPVRRARGGRQGLGVADVFARAYRSGVLHLACAEHYLDTPGDQKTLTAKAAAVATAGLDMLAAQSSVPPHVRVRLYLLRARAQAMNTGLRAALKDISAAYALAPDDPEVHRTEGLLRHDAWQLVECRPCLQRAVDLAAASGARQVHGRALLLLGSAARKEDRSEEARRLLTQALAEFVSRCDFAGEAQALDALGHAWRALQRLDQARECFTRALRLKRQIGDLPGYARSLGGLGALEFKAGRLAEAEEWFRQDLDVARQIGDRRGVVVCLNYFGEIALEDKRPEDAIRWHEQALLECGDDPGLAQGRQDAKEGIRNVRNALARTSQARPDSSSAS
jgi:tetratricopeptide (TPR) repeat protein